MYIEKRGERGSKGIVAVVVEIDTYKWDTMKSIVIG